MSVVVAGLFDSGVAATEAMDKLMREDIKGMETRVLEPGQRNTSGEPDVIVPVIPNTSGGFGNPASTAPAAAVAGELGWLNDMDRVERNFYSSGYREGSTLAMIKVDNEEDAAHVRDLLNNYGARTYVRD